MNINFFNREYDGDQELIIEMFHYVQLLSYDYTVFLFFQQRV